VGGVAAGARLCQLRTLLAAGAGEAMVAGLVNASAVGMAAAAAGPPVTVVACGERWEAATLPRGRTRRGAVIVASGLPGSPEARAAASAFSGLRDQPAAASLGLRERKGADAVRFMARLDTLPVVPRRGTDGWIRGSGGQ